MNKVELIATISEKAELSKKDAERALQAFIDTVQEAMIAGEKVHIVGFGTFVAVDRAARVGRNPQTQETIQLPKSKAPKFKPSKSLKDLVNE